MLLIAAAAGGIGVAMDHLVPEEVGSQMRLRGSGQFIFASFCYDLRDESVCVPGAEVLTALVKRIDDIVMMEPLCQVPVFGISGEGI